MDNEKNNDQNPNRKRHRFQKPKGYFIEPNTENAEKKDQSIKIENVASEGQDKAQKQKKAENQPEKRNPSQNQNQNRNSGENVQQKKNHHKHHRRSDRPKEVSEEKEQGQPQPQQARPQKPAEEGTGKKPTQNRPHRNKGNKNEHKAPDGKNTAPQKKSDSSAEKTKTVPQRKERKLEAVPVTKTVDADFDVNDYEQIRFPSSEENEQIAKGVESEEPAKLVEVVGIRFKSTGKVYYFEPNGKTLKRGEYAIVETARGQEYGEVAMGNKMVKESDTVSPLRPIIRVATEADKKHHIDNKAKEENAFRVCNEKIISHGLDMKLIDAQYTFDNSKLLFYFTSAGRVDFRDLVKDLASVFKTRIELRQIGIRDEAKLMGGVGMCGRPLCCTLFLSDFGQVSIKMAKEQNLSLNSAKISGICGRLMCCLRYEHETYEYEIKRTPPVDAFVHTEDGNGTVTEINPLAGTIKVRLTSTPEAPPKTYKREDVVMLQKKQNKQEQNG